MKAETTAMFKHGFWGAVVGAVIAIIIGFTLGGWQTRGMAEEEAVATAAAICVAQFMKQPDAQERLKELQAVSTWDRPWFIEKGGWHTMPGEAQARPGVSRACAEGLALLLEK
jgi:hypothetical protein